jgi:hypothetical protein
MPKPLASLLGLANVLPVLRRRPKSGVAPGRLVNAREKCVQHSRTRKIGINGFACTKLSSSGTGLLFEEEPLENNGKERLVNVLNGASPYGSPAAFGALVRHASTMFS